LKQKNYRDNFLKAWQTGQEIIAESNTIAPTKPRREFHSEQIGIFITCFYFSSPFFAFSVTDMRQPFLSVITVQPVNITFLKFFHTITLDEIKIIFY